MHLRLAPLRPEAQLAPSKRYAYARAMTQYTARLSQPGMPSAAEARFLAPFTLISKLLHDTNTVGYAGLMVEMRTRLMNADETITNLYSKAGRPSYYNS